MGYRVVRGSWRCHLCRLYLSSQCCCWSFRNLQAIHNTVSLTLPLCSALATAVQKQETIASILSLNGNPTRRRLDEKIEQHSLISTLLSGGYYNQWENEHKRRIEVQQELDGELQEKPLDIIITNCVFEVCMSCRSCCMISLNFIVSL